MVLKTAWRTTAGAWLIVMSLAAMAQGQKALTENPRRPAAPRTAPPAAVTVPSNPAVVAPAAAAPARVSGEGYRVEARPGWVVDPPAESATPSSRSGASPIDSARRMLLMDQQENHALPRVQSYFHYRAVALDASTLAAMSQIQVQFNPAFQTVALHAISIEREGRRLDRLTGARIEVMRREQGLERQVITGSQTLLIVLNDVRVGETVEVAYTVEGVNPIYDGHVSSGMPVAWDLPIDLLHQRVLVPPDRKLYLRPLGSGGMVPELSAESGLQVLRLVRRQVAPVVEEASTPPWFKVYPAWQLSDFAGWREVDAWAQRLFAMPAQPGPAVQARAQAFRASGLQGEALVAEVLRFVQDEVRYFSVSLGESSHRPKPAEQTLADLLGDCKDKVVLLNALLGTLGFDVKPALVSMQRNRALVDYLPSQDEFDHVVTRLELNGRVYYLDGTLVGQGTTLASRGYLSYGHALVVGAGSDALESVRPPTDALDHLGFEQRWDLSRPGEPARLVAEMRARGLAAEYFRARIAQLGLQRVGEVLAGAQVRASPGLRVAGEARMTDDRASNTLVLSQDFEHPEPGRYSAGGLDVEFNAVELFDFLRTPSEPQRRTPYMIDNPRLVTASIIVSTPRSFGAQAPGVTDVPSRQISYEMRASFNGSTVRMDHRVAQRADEVLPGDVTRFRDDVTRMRQSAQHRLRMSLIDLQALRPDFDQVSRALWAKRPVRDDLSELLLRFEARRLMDTRTLSTLPASGLLTARVLAARAVHNNSLGDFVAGLRDADAALAMVADDEDALEARAVALLGGERAEEALHAFDRLAQTSRRASALAWSGEIHLHLGRAPKAESLLREALEGLGASERDYVLLWLYLAAETQGAGRGRAAVAGHLGSADPTRLPGAMLMYLDGRMDSAALLRMAAEKPESSALGTAEASFFIARRFTAQGRDDEARRWYARVLETQAVPYREFTFARLELRTAR